MTKKLISFEVLPLYKQFQIQEFIDGKRFRRVLNPTDSITEDENQKIKDNAKELWTDKVKKSYQELLDNNKDKL